jgi:hypothetical protein
MSGNKYHARRVGGFDSKKEARRFQELLLMQRAGKISGLQRQVAFELIPAQREPDRRGPRGGVIPGKTIERPVKYVADFVYFDRLTGEKVIEDTKGVKTPDYIIKRKLMLYLKGYRIKET